MIQINLIPEEFKRSSTLPARSLLVLAIASLLGFGSVGALGYLFFNVRAEAANRVEIAQEQLSHLSAREKYADDLDRERAEFEKRHKTIQEIAGSRILWTKKMDRLSTVINTDRTSGRHQVWLSSLDVDARASSKAGGMGLKGHSATANLEAVSNFHEDLQSDPVFAQGFVLFTAPSSRLGDRNDEVDPPDQMDFTFDVKLPVKETKKAAPAKPAKAPPAADSK